MARRREERGEGEGEGKNSFLSLQIDKAYNRREHECKQHREIETQRNGCLAFTNYMNKAHQFQDGPDSWLCGQLCLPRREDKFAKNGAMEGRDDEGLSYWWWPGCVPGTVLNALSTFFHLVIFLKCIFKQPPMPPPLERKNALLNYLRHTENAR